MTDRNDEIPGCLGFLLVLLGVWALIALARGQDRPSEALLLARLTAHEAGLSSPADAGLIHEVLTGIVERDEVSYQRAIELASPRWARGVTPRPWTLELAPDGRRPPHWHRGSWPLHAPRWAALLEHAARVIAGQISSPCRERPRVWGSSADVARGIRRGHRWHDAGCVGTRNRGGRWG